MELIGDLLTLRPPVDDDSDAVAAGVQASLSELVPWMPWATPGYGSAEALGWIRGETGDPHRFVMLDAANDIVGSCGLNGVDDANRSANLGYWVRSDRAGEGFATEAAKLLARFGFSEPGFQRLEIVMSTRNHPSRRVAEKAGALHEGVARSSLLLQGEFHDAHVWSLIAGEE